MTLISGWCLAPCGGIGWSQHSFQGIGLHVVKPTITADSKPLAEHWDCLPGSGLRHAGGAVWGKPAPPLPVLCMCFSGYIAVKYRAASFLILHLYKALKYTCKKVKHQHDHKRTAAKAATMTTVWVLREQPSAEKKLHKAVCACLCISLPLTTLLFQSLHALNWVVNVNCKQWRGSGTKGLNSVLCLTYSSVQNYV